MDEIATIFNRDFRLALGGGSPKHTGKATDPSTSRGGETNGSEKQGARRRRTKGARGYDPEDDGSDKSDDSSVEGGYRRSCTFVRNQKRCWLFDDLHKWNSVLAKGFVELVEYKWGEFCLQGYPSPEIGMPSNREILQVSLLMNFALRKHRCITRIEMDTVVTTIEQYMFWDGVKHHVADIDYLEYQSDYALLFPPLHTEKDDLWAQATAKLDKLRNLHLSRVFLSRVIAGELSNYFETNTSLTTMHLINVWADVADDIATFLSGLAKNKSLKFLSVTGELVEHPAFPDVLCTHKTLEKLEVHGSGMTHPKEALQAAVQCITLQTLILHNCTLDADDVGKLADALKLNPTSLEDAPAQPDVAVALYDLTITGCRDQDELLERAYCDLIGGRLRRLTLQDCRLTDVFVSAVAKKLLAEDRIEHLFIQMNPEITISGLCLLLKAMWVNPSLATLGLDIPPALDLFALFKAIRGHDIAHRLVFGWSNTPGEAFADGCDLCDRGSFYVDFSMRTPEDTDLFLCTLAKCRKLDTGHLDCDYRSSESVLLTLSEHLSRLKYLREAKLCFSISEEEVVHMFRSLETNKSIRKLLISNTVFHKRTIRALCRMVEMNKTIIMLSIDLQHSGPDNFQQMRAICHELQDSIVQNRYLLSLSITTADDNRASDYPLKQALRRNRALVNQAIRFIYGSMETSDALAFDALSYTASLGAVMYDHYDVGNRESDSLIVQARNRVASNYFTLAGIVRRRAVCAAPASPGLKQIDDLSNNLQHRICSYLRLGDIVDL